MVAVRLDSDAGMLLRTRPRPNGFIEPCLPSPAPKPPTGPSQACSPHLGSDPVHQGSSKPEG
jgi:hypothetical protein